MKPGSAMTAKTPAAASTIMNRMFKATSKVKTTGTFHGKSNALGYGGRAAQLKAQGVPGGVIGNLARAAHAAPGQANYHGKKSAIRKKGAIGGIGAMPARMANVKNPAWVAQGQAKNAATPASVNAGRGLAGGRLVFNSDNTNTSPAVANSTPQASLKGKSAKRKKATKLENDAVYKKVPKKKVASKKAKKMSAECE